MKKRTCMLALSLLPVLFLAGCALNKDSREKDLQRLSQIEIYSGDGELVNTIEDENILYQFRQLDDTDTSFESDSEQEEQKPYNKITVQNIVERCQVNRNTFYYHFQDIPALAEYSIQEWTDQVIKDHCELGSPRRCITLIAQEFVSRKSAFLHIYRSSHREATIRYLNEISPFLFYLLYFNIDSF